MSSLYKFLSFFAVVAFCSIFFSFAAEASPNIKYHVQHVRLNNQGEATIEGYFENTGDRDAYAKSITLDLTLMTNNGNLIWSDSGIEHYLDIYVPAYGAVEYTYYVQNPDIPEYHGKFRYRWHTHTHWDTSAG